jgi:hypothetical protein
VCRCLFTNIVKYEFKKVMQYDARMEEPPRQRLVYVLVIRDFRMHSMHENLTSDILQPPEFEELPKVT